MRNLILSALVLASAFQTAVGQIVEGQWTYIVENGGATITASTATGAVTIPSVLNGIPVVRIGNVWASGGSTSIFGATVLTPNNSVTSITIPNSVTSIGAYVFAYCHGLTGTFTIPDSVTTIGESAFQGCAELTTLTIPNSVTSIGDYAFADCSLTGTFTIPDSVTSIGNGVFTYCHRLTRINIPNSVTSIGNYAFYSCPSLTSITIPNSVTSIGIYAFFFCPSLTSITIPNSVTSIGDYAFQGCSGLTGTLTIPNSVTSIGDYAFQGCSGLTAFTMPERFIGQVAQIGIRGQVATDYLINALANNDAFVTAVANKIKATGGTYGIATQSGLSSAITTAVEPLATKSELTSSLAQSRTDGINSVLSNPNLWTLYTTSQIQNMAVGDLVLTRQVSGGFVLNYDIEQSTDLQTWTPYQALSLPLTGLPTDKAFVRIKAKQ